MASTATVAHAQAVGPQTDTAARERPAASWTAHQPDGSARASVAVPAASQVAGEAPAAVELPGGAVLEVDPVATDAGGSLELPESVFHAGWWEGSARLGDPYGAIVIAAHVDSFTDGVGPIAELLDARPGDVVRVESAGMGQSYTISRSVFVPRTELAAERGAMSFAGPRRLVLITCAGPFDAEQGGYRYNLVVVAEPEGPLERGGD